MIFLGVIQIPGTGAVSNLSTAVPFSIDGYASIAIEPSTDGLRAELYSPATAAWQTTVARGVTVPSSGTSFVQLRTGGRSKTALSVIDPDGGGSSMRVWGLYP